MARKSPKLKVVITPGAMRDLDSVWDSNAERYGADHADLYVSFLRREAYKLESSYQFAKQVPTAAEFLYANLRWSRRRQSHAHVVIFQIHAQTVEVLRFFQTRQDWQGRAEKGQI